MMTTVRGSLLLMAALGLVALGCGSTPTSTPGKDTPQPNKDAKDNQANKDAKDAKDKGTKAQDHSGWWCAEHGVPEAECSMCSTKVFKALKPDEICPKHPDRAKAQCFICNPDLWPKYVAVYKAKHGQDKEPPEPEDNLPGGKSTKKDK